MAAVNRRATTRLRFRGGGALAAVMLVAGCSEVSPEYNPIEWGRGIGRALFGGEGTGGPAHSIEPPSAEGRPYPNLASVPRPPPVRSPNERALDRQRLLADQSSAELADASLRGAAGGQSFTIAFPDGSNEPTVQGRQLIESAARRALLREGRVRIVGPTGPVQLVGAELERLGVPRGRIALDARTARGPVEIFIDSSAIAN